MADDVETEVPPEEVEEKGDALEQQFAEADAEADVDVPQASLEEIAEELGWKPKEKYKGDPTTWKPADQYLRRSRKEARGLKVQIERLTQTLDNVSRTTGQIMQEKLAEQHRELSQRYASAIERGDADEAWKVGNEIRDLKESATKPAQQFKEPDEVTVKWAERNPWMKTHPIARQLAIEVADQFAREGASAEVQTREAEAVVRAQFPHLFQDGGQAPQVNGVRSRAAPRAPRGTTYKDMPKEAQAVADDLHDRGLIDDKERYARNYFAQASKGQ